jgi:type IV secretion system protein TrbK
VSRAALIDAVCVLVAGLAVVTNLVLVRSETPAAPVVSDEQWATREKFFGTNKPLPPIEKGQEMRPRW